MAATGYLTQATIGGSDYLLTNALYGTCETAAATAAKVVSLKGFDSLETGVTIHVKFTYSNTASNATMNVQGTGAKNLCRYGTTRVGTTERASWKAGAVVSFTYDGTSWVQNDYLEDTGVTTDTRNTAGNDSSSETLYLIGSYIVSTSGSNGTSRTYANSNVYATDGVVYAKDYMAIDRQGNIGTFNGLKIEGNATVPYTSPVLTFVSNVSGVSDSSLSWSGNYVLGAACAKGVDTSISSGSTSTNVPTSAAVASLVASMQAGAATFQGTLVASDGDGTTSWTEAQLEAASYTKGWYWVCATMGTYAGKNLEPGDMLFCVSDKGNAYAAADFAAVQNNIETLTNAEIDALWAAA